MCDVWLTCPLSFRLKFPCRSVFTLTIQGPGDTLQSLFMMHRRLFCRSWDDPHVYQGPHTRVKCSSGAALLNLYGWVLQVDSDQDHKATLNRKIRKGVFHLIAMTQTESDYRNVHVLVSEGTGILRQAGRCICKWEEPFLVRTMFFFPQSCKVKASAWLPHQVWAECPQDARGTVSVLTMTFPVASRWRYINNRIVQHLTYFFTSTPQSSFQQCLPVFQPLPVLCWKSKIRQTTTPTASDEVKSFAILKKLGQNHPFN